MGQKMVIDTRLRFADGKMYEPNDVYYVTAKFGRKKVFGIAAYFGSNEGKDLWKDGKVLIEDAVTPKRYAIPSTAVTPVRSEPPRLDPEKGWIGGDEVSQHVIDEEKKQAKFDEENYDKFIVGRSFSVSVADGSATYVVTKILKTRVHIEWRGFCPDRWVDQYLGYGGSFDRERIERMVPMHKPLFGRR